MSKLVCEYADCTNNPTHQCDNCGDSMCFSHILIDKGMEQLDSDNFKLQTDKGLIYVLFVLSSAILAVNAWSGLHDIF